MLGLGIVGAIVASRVIGDKMPNWMFAVFLIVLAVAVALDITAVWELHDIGRNATAALAVGMTLLLVVTLRGGAEVLISAGALGVGLAILMFLDTPPGTTSTPTGSRRRSPPSPSPSSPP